MFSSEYISISADAACTNGSVSAGEELDALSNMDKK